MDSVNFLVQLDGWPRLMVDALCLSTLIASLSMISIFCWVRQPAARAWLLLLAITACAVLPMTNCLVRTAGWGVPIRVAEMEPTPVPVDSRRDDIVAQRAEHKVLVMPANQPVDSQNDLWPVSEAFTAEAGPMMESISTVGRKQFVFSLLGCLWLGLSTILLLRLLASVFSVHGIARSARPCTDDRILDAIARTSKQLGLRSAPRTLVSDKISTPMVLAFFRTTLFIPDDKRILTSEKHLGTVLAHELAHIKRHDGWKRLVVHLVVVLLPLQPLVWLMNRSFFAAAEEACDDIAVAGGNDPVDLAAVLTAWSGFSKDQGKLLLTAGMSATRSRVLRLLNKAYKPMPRLSTSWQCWVSTIVLIFCSGLSLTHLSNEPEPVLGSAQDEPAVIAGNFETISGTCVDEKGQPIPNVKIRLFRFAVNNTDLQETELESTTSNAEGKFEFRHESFSEKSSCWLLIAQSQGRETGQRFINPAIEPVDGLPITLKLLPAQTLRGKVRDSRGNPVRGAVVSFLSPLANPVDGILASISDENGDYEITDLRSLDLAKAKPHPQGDGSSIVVSGYFGTVRHRDYARDRFSVSKVPGTVDITLHAPAIVEGQIILEENGKPAAGAAIEFWNANVDRWTAVADENGRYEIKQMPPGKYRVGVRFVNRPNLFLPDVELVEGDNRKDISLERGGILKGQVVNVFSDEPFRLAEDETMQISEHDGDGVSYAGMSHKNIEPDGSFELLMPAGRRHFGMYIGKKWRGVNLDKFSKQGVEIVEGETKEVELRIRPRKKPAKPAVGPQMDVPTQAAVAAIKQLGGWVEFETIDGQQHVVEVNMVFHEDEEFGRDDNDLIHDECLSYVHKFPHLKRLLLKEQQATDAGLARIRGLKNLEKIYIWDAFAVSDVGVAHLAEMTNLETIHLGNSKITDESLRIFSKLSKLEYLSLQGNSFTDKGLGYIQNLSQLKSLWLGLGESEFTDDGLKYLARLTQLETLSLQGSSITDSGLKLLHPLKQLKELHQNSSKVTAEGYANLKKVLPKLDR